MSKKEVSNSRDYQFHKFVLEAGPSDFRSLGEYLEKQYPGKQS